MTITALGDSAMVITLGEALDPAVSDRVRAVVSAIRRERPAGVVDVVGAFASVAVFGGQRAVVEWDALRSQLTEIAERAGAEQGVPASREREIPVHYGGTDGPDLAVVAEHAGMTEEAVIAAHASGEYRVQAIGFAPGFPYLTGLPERLATPRRATPRASVPAGAVGIGGVQTGVYPFATPGGWNLIGRSPLRLFDVRRAEPAWLEVGDRVRFRAINEDEFRRLATETDEKVAEEKLPDTDGNVRRVTVIRAGMLTTVQAAGREGYRDRGVALGGPVDAMALRVANLLVGNAPDAAALEFTLQGPTLEFETDAVVALGGADFGVSRWRPLRVRAGERVTLGVARDGCRGYLAIAGGIEVPVVLGSRSTDLRAGFGGLDGRALRNGDRLRLGIPAGEVRGRWALDERILSRYSRDAVVRIVAGAQSDEFDAGWHDQVFTVTPRSDRMGVRLSGRPVTRKTSAELLSAPVTPGTIQVPPDGQPIVLQVDAQTIGGYPKIGHVIAVDQPIVAQLGPGDRLRFERVTEEAAKFAFRTRERALGWLREGIREKLA